MNTTIAAAPAEPAPDLASVIEAASVRPPRVADIVEGVIFYGLLILGVSVPILAALVGWIVR